jgi:hypothetical protein
MFCFESCVHLFLLSTYLSNPGVSCVLAELAFRGLYGAIATAAHDRAAGNGANDSPNLQYQEHTGFQRRDEHTDIIS